MRSVLINGAGIAGDALAVLLARAGWRVVVAEIAPALRSGGQTVDLRGDSREVLERLGLLDAALAHLVPQRGIAWVDGAGRRCAAMPVEAFGGRGFISTEELLRTDLARLLHEAAVSAGVEHRFGETVDAFQDGPDGVHVRFRSGGTESFGIVVGADGAHSRVRALRFGPEKRFRHPLGLSHAWYTLTETAGTPSLGGWAVVHLATGRRAVAARPGHAGEQEVGLTFAADALPERDDHEGRLALLERTFAGAGWRSVELLAAARTAPDFALETYDQIRMPAWSAGRVVLVGDAAWCSSPLSGLGTALGLRGAAALADAIGDGSALQLGDAFAGFERAMRGRVDAAQRLFPGRVAMAAPRTRLGIAITTGAMTALQWRVWSPLLMRAFADHGREPGSRAAA